MASGSSAQLPADPPGQPSRPQEAAGADRVNVLLVDDEPRNLLALEAVLARPDRSLVRAASGEEALKHLLRDEFAVVVLDVHMGGMDGFETATLIRQRDSLRATPIIFLTATHPSDAYAARGYAAGAVDYLSKPFDAHVLEAKVAVFVELFRKRKEVERQATAMARLAHLEGVLLASRTFEHELNTKLTATSGYAELLLRDPDLPPRLRERAARCLDGAQEASRIIRHLIEITDGRAADAAEGDDLGPLRVHDWDAHGTTIDVSRQEE